MNKDQALEKIKEEVVNCQKCSLSDSRHLPVVGEGDHDADIMLTGEAPGSEEDRTGRPFVGPAGQILNDLLEANGFAREEVYINNVLKCRPPDNRDPRKEEIEVCAPYLNRQIEIIDPDILCPLGNFAARYLLKRYNLKEQAADESGKIKGITKLHGEVFEVQSLTQSFKVMPLFHPAAATYNPNLEQTLMKDFKKLREVYDSLQD